MFKTESMSIQMVVDNVKKQELYLKYCDITNVEIEWAPTSASYLEGPVLKSRPE
jgi:hypothetical protein